MIFCLLQADFPIFTGHFNELRWDEYGNFLTRRLNGLSYSDLPKKFNEIPKPLSLKYLLDSDTSKLQYKYIAYNYDTDESKELVEDYKHYAIGLIKHKSYDLFIYSRFNDEDENFFMKSISKAGKSVDEIAVSQMIHEEGGVGLEVVRFSLISPDSIKVFTYEYAENPDRKENKKTPLVTKVVIEDYAIDSLGKFNKVAIDSMLLSKPMNAYLGFIHMPEGDDPVRKYWTLW